MIASLALEFTSQQNEAISSQRTWLGHPYGGEDADDTFAEGRHED